MLTQGRLLEVVLYDPETGDFVWRNRPVQKSRDATWNTKWAGKKAGTEHAAGYLMFSVDDKRYLSHRLAWLYMTGEWPPHQIDHKDMNRQNNRWSNLRLATNQQNTFNRKVQSNCKSGLRGVHFHAKSNMWHGRITHNGRVYSLGYSKSAEKLAARYAAKARELRGEFHRD